MKKVIAQRFFNLIFWGFIQFIFIKTNVVGASQNFEKIAVLDNTAFCKNSWMQNASEIRIKNTNHIPILNGNGSKNDFVNFANYQNSKNPHLVSYKQGVVEIVIDVSDVQFQKTFSIYIDSFFLVARLAINELNKSLSYKMNDQIRIFVHSPVSKFDIESPLLSNIEFNESLLEMKRQIRFSIAQQYLQEYLGGILMREKLSPTAIKPPAWLILGFCSYFSKAITFNEFEKFSYLAKKGKFNNINFIEPQYEQLFGTIIWYLFEKEKGSSINGAFWLLLKNANSFERTFYYHFEERFNVWLKKRILEIESMGFNEGKQSDFQIPLKYIEIQSIELDINNKQFLIYHNSGRTPLKKKINLNEYIDFESSSIHLNDSNLFINSHTQSVDNSIFHNTINSKIILQKPIPFNRFFTVINRVFAYSDTQIMLGLIARLDTSNDGSNPILIDTVFLHKFVKESIDFSDWVLESPDHFSLIRTTGNHSEVLHYIYSESEKKWNSFATGTKGYFYHQLAIDNSNQFLEYYILNNQLHANSLNKNGELLLRDTLQKITYSFDTLKTDSVLNNKNLWDSTKWYISPFEFNKSRINIPRKNNNSFLNQHTYKIENFRNWQYTEMSIYYLSNNELDLYYNSNIPVERLYNSPITLFYKGSFPNLLKQSTLNFLAFTNVNRRRLGFQISHQYKFKNNIINQQFQYRIRQFTLSNSNYFRNRSIRYDVGIYKNLLKESQKKIHRQLGINIYSKNHIDQIIPLNLNEISTRAPIQNIQLQTINVELNQGFKIPISRINLTADYSFNMENGYYKNSGETEWISAIGATVNVSKRFRMLNWNTRIKSRYSITQKNVFYWLMGNNGWIDPNQFNNSSGYSGEFIRQYPLQGVGGNVRGISSASRGGTSYFNIQSELSLPITSLIPSYSINGPFLKSLKFYIWGDAGIGFVNGSPYHYKNPYNTLVYSTPNYLLTATANRDPWISSRGFGIKFKLIEMDFRLEYGLGKVGDFSSRPQFSISMGNIF